MFLALLSLIAPAWADDCKVDAVHQPTIDKLVRMSRSPTASEDDPRLVKKTGLIEYRVAPLSEVSVTLYVTVTIPNESTSFHYLDIAKSGTLLGIVPSACDDARAKAHAALAELSSIAPPK